MNTYKPKPSDLEWARNVIRMLRDGGAWAAPIIGIFMLDKARKRLVLQERSPGYQDRAFQQTVVVFGAIGYTVVEKS